MTDEKPDGAEPVPPKPGDVAPVEPVEPVDLKPVDPEPGGAEPVGEPVAEPSRSEADTDPAGLPVVTDEGPPPGENGDGPPASREGASLGRRLWPPSRGQLLVAGLLALLGFAVVVQTRQTQEDGLASLRQSDLVRIFDNLQQQSERLEEDAQDLQEQQDDLRGGTDRTAAAEAAARRRLEVLGILAGTLPATGPGITLEITDPQARVTAAMLIDTVQELRDAGAEAIQVGDVRVVASTSFVDGPDGIVADGTELRPPYRFAAIGDPPTMRSALDIPGGVLETLRSGGAEGTVEPVDTLAVDALRQVKKPQYAQPAPSGKP